jgi:uncharacterized protein (DUF885 family)
MRTLFLITLIALGAVGCSPKETNASDKKPADMNAAFDRYKENYIESLWKIYPGWATSMGYHKYDSMLVVPDAASRERELAFAKSHLDSLKKYADAELNDNNTTDLQMLQNQLESVVWSVSTLRSWEWNPSEYNVCGSFSELLSNEASPLEERLRNIYLKMANVPAYYEAAKANIKAPTAEHTLLAIEQNTGGVSVFEKDLPEAINKLKAGEHEKQAMLATAKASAKAVRDYAAWLQTLDAKKARSFRLGKDLYAKKFELDIQSGFTVDQIYSKALAHKKDLHGKMFLLADKLWSKYMGNASKPADSLQLIRAVIDKISLKHVKPDEFQKAIEQQIPVLVDFINKKKLITLDPSKPLVVRKEPDYMAGVAGASISAPGPYDKNGNTYYNVGSLSGWDAERAESYLREYNHYILQILNIHEAIPGHYTQLVYANQSPSLVKSLFGNSAMIEGWAVYTERMMLENGYGAEKDGDQASDEMWLMYYKWNLRSTCNTILDYSVHTKNMSKEQALDLLMREGFQQKAEAEGKWRRATLTQVQLCCYFTGFTEIISLREDMQRKQRDSFDLQKFHEKFLSYGSAPVRYIRDLMMAELDKSAK